MIHWFGYTTGGECFHEQKSPSARELLEDLIDEDVIDAYWVPGSDSAIYLAEHYDEFAEVYQQGDASAVKRFNFNNLFNQMSERDIFRLIRACDDQAYEQRFIVDGEEILIEE